MHGGEGMHGRGGHAWQGGYAWQGGSVHGRGACVPQGYHETRSMSGRYASYWNAFLLQYCFNVFFFIPETLIQFSK